MTDRPKERGVRLDGDVAIVTGAGNGLGRAHALHLAGLGARVVVNDIATRVDETGRPIHVADDVVAEIRRMGGEAVADHSSVTTRAGGEQIADTAMSAFGRIDVLVNNAGNIALKSFLKLDLAEIDRILDVHLRGAFYVTQPCYRRMVEQQYGRIVFTVSGVGLWGNGGVSAYSAAKGGIFGLLQVLKLEAARHQIKVNAVAPMATTQLTGDVGMPDYLAVQPEEVRPELVSPVVAYLASRDCGVTGETWSAGSGAVSRVFVGRAEGYFKHPVTDGPLTVDDVATNIDLIRDGSQFRELNNWPDEFRLISEQLRGLPLSADASPQDTAKPQEELAK